MEEDNTRVIDSIVFKTVEIGNEVDNNPDIPRDVLDDIEDMLDHIKTLLR
jgi:hypothetical protein